MSDSDVFNADQQAFWNGAGGEMWVRRQAHTDIILAPVSKALLAFAAPRHGESVLDVGCGCGASTLDFARAVGASGRVAALDISGPMLAEGVARARAAGITNIDWRQEDPATAALEPYDLLTSNFGLMFFGDPVTAFSHMRKSARPGARMAFVCWRPLGENPWMDIPMRAVAAHLPPRPKPNPGAPGMFAFADPRHVEQIFSASGWTKPEFRKLDLKVDIAAGHGIDEAVAQLTQIGAVNSWLRGQPEDIVSTCIVSLRNALMPYREADSVRLPAAMWLVGSAPA